jgi:hypothetical protein
LNYTERRENRKGRWGDGESWRNGIKIHETRQTTHDTRNKSHLDHNAIIGEFKIDPLLGGAGGGFNIIKQNMINI